ncbi:hypothetical protein LXL04_003638 [Taraxacum kok-saghyz]
MDQSKWKDGLRLETKLRIGLAEQTLLTALGHAIACTEKHPTDLEDAAKIVKQVYSVIPVYDKIISFKIWSLLVSINMMVKGRRNAERNTEKFPDVVVAASRVKKPSVTSFVLDCEIVAYDRKKQKILPFQILSTRARKNVVMSEIKGISLRFPRILHVREDKGPEDASSSYMVADMYNAQKHTQGNNQDDNDDE